MMVIWIDKCHNSKCPLLFYCWTWHDTYGMGYLFYQWRSAVPAVSLPTFLWLLSLITGKAVQETEKVLTLCKHCSATAIMSLCYQHSFGCKSKPAPWKVLWRKLYSSQNQDPSQKKKQQQNQNQPNKQNPNKTRVKSAEFWDVYPTETVWKISSVFIRRPGVCCSFVRDFQWEFYTEHKWLLHEYFIVRGTHEMNLICT